MKSQTGFRGHEVVSLNALAPGVEEEQQVECRPPRLVGTNCEKVIARLVLLLSSFPSLFQLDSLPGPQVAIQLA